MSSYQITSNNSSHPVSISFTDQEESSAKEYGPSYFDPYFQMIGQSRMPHWTIFLLWC